LLDRLRHDCAHEAIALDVIAAYEQQPRREEQRSMKWDGDRESLFERQSKQREAALPTYPIHRGVATPLMATQAGGRVEASRSDG
jgi:hypothetical protein